MPKIQGYDKKIWAGDKRLRNTFAEKYQINLLLYYRDTDPDEDQDVKQEYECNWQKKWPQCGLLHTEILILVQSCKPATLNIKRDRFKREVALFRIPKQNNVPFSILKDLTVLSRSCQLSSERQPFLPKWGLSVMLLFLWGMQNDTSNKLHREIIRCSITNLVTTCTFIFRIYFTVESNGEDLMDKGWRKTGTTSEEQGYPVTTFTSFLLNFPIISG